MMTIGPVFQWLSALLIVPLIVAQHSTVSLVSKRDIGSVQVYVPPQNYLFDRVLYARHVLFPDEKGTLLATFETYPPVGALPTFPIYRSTDHGAKWSALSRVEDTQNGWGMTSQPFLYVLQQPHGDFRAGTLLCVGVSVTADSSSMKIEVYASNNTGNTWGWVSTVTQEVPVNGKHAVWTPFLLETTTSIVIYYSITRDPSQGQKIVHQSSSDLVKWGASVDDVLDTTKQNGMVGMATVSPLPNGRYMMTYEYRDAPEGKYAVYYKIATSPNKFLTADAHVLQTPDGASYFQSPYVLWLATEGEDGVIVVSTGWTSDLLINTALGSPTKWIRVPAPSSAGSWARGLASGYELGQVTIIDGGRIGQKGKNTVTFSAVALPV